MRVLGSVNAVVSCSTALDIVGYFAKFCITNRYNYVYHNFNIRSCSSECGTFYYTIGGLWVNN